jgi:hypothetical protein
VATLNPWHSKFQVNSTDTADSLNNNATFAAEQLAIYETNHSGASFDALFPTLIISVPSPGALSNALAGTVQFGRVPYLPGVLTPSNDPSAGPNSPHYEIIFGVGVHFIDSGDLRI